VYRSSENQAFSDKEANAALSSAKLAVQGVLAKVKVSSRQTIAKYQITC